MVSSSLTLHGQPVLTDTRFVPPLSRPPYKLRLAWSGGEQIYSVTVLGMYVFIRRRATTY